MITLTKQQPNFENIYFVSGALNLKSALFKTVLKVEKNIVYATDGGRIHLACIENIKDGFYQIIKKNKTLIVLEKAVCNSYPDLKDIFEIDYKYNIDTNHLDYNKEKRNGFACIIALINRGGFAVIPKQIDDIMSFGNFKISYNKNTEPIFFKLDSGEKAYLMPINEK